MHLIKVVIIINCWWTELSNWPVCFSFVKASADSYMAKVQQWPAVLPAEAEVCRLPNGNRAVSFLFVSARVGPVESSTGWVSCIGVHTGDHRRRYPITVLLRSAVAGDITNSGGERRREARPDPGARGCHEPQRDSTEPVGPEDKASTTFQQRSPGWRCHMAGLVESESEAR